EHDRRLGRSDRLPAGRAVRGRDAVHPARAARLLDGDLAALGPEHGARAAARAARAARPRVRGLARPGDGELGLGREAVARRPVDLEARLEPEARRDVGAVGEDARLRARPAAAVEAARVGEDHRPGRPGAGQDVLRGRLRLELVLLRVEAVLAVDLVALPRPEVRVATALGRPPQVLERARVLADVGE